MNIHHSCNYFNTFFSGLFFRRSVRNEPVYNDLWSNLLVVNQNVTQNRCIGRKTRLRNNHSCSFANEAVVSFLRVQKTFSNHVANGLNPFKQIFWFGTEDIISAFPGTGQRSILIVTPLRTNSNPIISPMLNSGIKAKLPA